MKIVFGTASFRLKSYKPTELGLPKELDSEMSIEKRQRYFHLFWIPVTTTGQAWAMRKKDNNLYECRPELLSSLKALPLKHKTPWYTFTGFILFCLAALTPVYVLAYNKIEMYNAAAKMREEIVNIKPDYCIQLIDKDMHWKFLKVIKINDDKLTCLHTGQSIETFDHEEACNAAFQVGMGLPAERFDTVVVSKTDLLKIYDIYDDKDADNHIFKGFPLFSPNDPVEFRYIMLLKN